MTDEVNVLDSTEDFLPDAGGKFVKHVKVRFKVGNQGPFTRHFPAEGFTGAQAKLALDQFAQELRLLKGTS